MSGPRRALERKGPAVLESAALHRTLGAIRRSLLDHEGSVNLRTFEERGRSARNFLHYVALRRFDLRAIQDQLARLGLSSLGRAEGHVLYNLDAVRDRLRGGPVRPPTSDLSPEEGRRLLEENATRLLGPSPSGRRSRIMVTMPTEAATDAGLVRDLVASGMDCMRINCAHDRPGDWAAMIRNLRRAERSLGRHCRVQMDLGGPKLRTGPLEPGPLVLKVRPLRDLTGRIERPARVWLTPSERPEPPPDGSDAVVPVLGKWLGPRRIGDRVRLRDARGKIRSLRIVGRRGASRIAVARKTVYVADGSEIWSSSEERARETSRVGPIPPTERPLLLRSGDALILTARPIVGRGPRSARGRGRTTPATISCTLPQALPFVRKGDPIWFDDGKIGAIVRRAGRTNLYLRITHAAPGGSPLRADKGINFPATYVNLTPLTEKDRADLKFVVRHADIVGYSFVHSSEDVDLLRRELERVGRPGIGVVLKIETRQAFDKLPAILFAALRIPAAGVMIARGDLAIEVGFERLTEVQEELLWLCEAAHLPSIWATQVLEGLAKQGLPTRAEVTDAAMGQRAECVMLSKGPHVVEAVRALDSILRRMEAHQQKKSARLRHLDVAERFLRGLGAPVPEGPRASAPSSP